MKTKNAETGENGSVLTFGIGLAVLLLMLVTISVNLASLWTTKVTLRTIADGAALSGAQAIDVADVYKYGVQSTARLSPNLARTRVADYLNQPAVRNRVHALEVVTIHVSGTEVKVTISCEPQLPFNYLLPTHVSRIQAVASARRELSR